MVRHDELSFLARLFVLFSVCVLFLDRPEKSQNAQPPHDAKRGNPSLHAKSHHVGRSYGMVQRCRVPQVQTRWQKPVNTLTRVARVFLVKPRRRCPLSLLWVGCDAALTESRPIEGNTRRGGVDSSTLPRVGDKLLGTSMGYFLQRVQNLILWYPLVIS